ncbi:MAG: sulfatase-like hydrolase/transferase, partial [bacterium]|nr:sulfatase-like hydrolase/transferase [bacterium]
RERGWYQQNDQQLGRALAGYYGNTSQMDANVGKVYDTLRELGLDKNTVVVYTSDHGEMAGAHRMWTKHNMYEQSVGVPLVVSMPGRIEAGTARDQLVEQIDLFPTLAELCGHKTPTGLHGRSFASLVRGGSYTPREFAYSEYYFCHRVFTQDNRYVGKPPMLMVRADRWKLNYLSWEASELYDVQRDPGEFHNVVDSPGNRGIVTELSAIAERMYRA